MIRRQQQSPHHGIGRDPWLVKDLDGTIKLKRSDAGSMKVTPLDFDGCPMKATGRRRK